MMAVIKTEEYRLKKTVILTGHVFCYFSVQTLLFCCRYIVIVYPMRSRSLCTMSNCKKAVVVVWSVSLVLAAPVIITKVFI